MTCTCGYSHLAATAVAGLTPRQREVLGLVAKGFTDQEVGARLQLSKYTVTEHLSTAMRALGVSNRVEAAVLATKAGLS